MKRNEDFGNNRKKEKERKRKRKEVRVAIIKKYLEGSPHRALSLSVF